MSATLYIVATPIGNLADISLRAIEILKRVHYIAAEDTRHSAFLLQHYDIQTPMLAYHEHSGEGQTDRLLALLDEGKDIALISDAGTPLISDPGYKLVERLHQRGGKVVPLPGASALLAALCASGMATDRFTFVGFLPAKKKAREDALMALHEREETLIVYEAPHRISEMLQDVVEVMGANRRVTLARELTKTFETIKQLPADQMCEWVQQDQNQQRGEIVLVIEGAQGAKADTEITVRAQQLISQLISELPPKTISKIISTHYEVPKKVVYDYVLSLKKE